MSYQYYQVDFYKLAVWLTPKFLRKQKFIILVKACLYPLISLHTTLMNFRSAKIYQIKITPQVCYLEMMLNDRYDSIARRITIGDAEWHLPWFLYQDAENKPEYLYTEGEAQPVYVYTDGEAGEALNDFVVLVPAAVSFNEQEMKSLLNSYKLFGTRYKIQIT